MRQPSIQSLCSGKGTVHIFFRDDDRGPFTYAGQGRPTDIRDVVPVEITWSFEEDTGPHPEFSPDEIWTPGERSRGREAQRHGEYI
jgi:5-methylcytosine-specific restriction protein A